MNDNNSKNYSNDDYLIDSVLDDLGLNTSPKKVYTAKNTDTSTNTNTYTESNNIKANESLESLTVKDLKARAKELGLPVSGKKDELIARIQNKD